MTTNELAPEKRIAAEPPVPTPESLAFSKPDKVLGEPPSMRLLLEGIESEALSPAFLVGVMDAADEHDLSVDGISIRRD